MKNEIPKILTKNHTSLVISPETHEVSDDDEPLTPAGRLFIQPELNFMVHCIIGLKDPIDLASLKSTIKSSTMIRLPRFQSIMVRDDRGVEHWRRTKVDIDRHIIIVNDPITINSTTTTVANTCSDGDDFSEQCMAAANQYVTESCVNVPFSSDKPLWEVHVLMSHRCFVFKVHHSLGDGISLMSMFLACTRRKDDPAALPSTVLLSSASASASTTDRVGKEMRKKVGCVWFWGLVKMVWFSLVYMVEFVLRSLWVRDPVTAITGGDNVQLRPKGLATARFSLQDMKLVKAVLPNATINDVLIGTITSGLSKYFRSSKDFSKEIRITGTAMVNIRPQKGLQELSDMTKRKSRSRWGNKFGFILLPLNIHNNIVEPLRYVMDAKKMVDRKKNSLEPYFSYHLLSLIESVTSPKILSRIIHRVLGNTSFAMSNVVGPREEIIVDGNEVTYIRVNTCGLPYGLTLHVVSYAGKIDMQVCVAKDVIHQPEFLAKCFEDAFLEIKEDAIKFIKIEK